MSTNDVPGAKAENRDVLAMGCWAEHEDGSLIHVESVEAGRVVYQIFDLSGTDPVEYRDAMPEKGFKTQFGWPNNLSLKWTWHDKTIFPWEKVMRDFPAGSKIPSASQLLSAAARVAQSLGLRAQSITRDQRAASQRTPNDIMRRLSTALHALDDIRQDIDAHLDDQR